ncbi:DUF6612 family protein [Planococcus sp. YIM B11945]|uniref:DUF6612 family protein n=1 Tax=Planococcus sp. YIM B11945 TaxID=3435410 RepID=UPI003D7D3F4A
MSNLKKWMAVMGTGFLAFGLAACNSTAEPVGNSGDKNSEKNSELTLQEVFAKSTEASEKVKSLHADISTNQLMAMGAEGMEMEMNMDIGMDMTIDPLAFYQTMETTILSEDIENENPLAMEMYYTEDGLFTYEPTMDAWVKMPAESLGEIEDLMSQESADPSEQLDQLAAFQDDFSFEQSADEYILKLDASGDEFKALLDSQLDQVMGQMEIEAQSLLEDMVIHSANFEIFIDKETFLPNSMNVQMDMDISIEGETMNTKSDVKTTYSQYDKIDAITVPAEVLDNAQELSY